ncbi:actin maturation protease isoform X2 [Cynocephalus volans]|uniref:actin maturation protease isoform X2 n=1 Tax=Cynocephalus volans TaxID=110931 RepID=UPI002FCAB7B2
MTSPCCHPPDPPIPPPRTPAPQAPIIPSLPLSPVPRNLAFPPAPSSLQASIPPPPPLPLPPPAMGAAPPHVFGLEKSRLLKEALEKASPVPKGREDVKRLLKLRKDRFRSDLRWILFCADLPSLIQEGPQCGLVALWMAGTLLSPPSGIPLERLVQVAMERGYTAQGEMFSVADMGRLAQEVLGCQAELLCGGLGSPNRDLVLQHLVSGQPLLIPYDEDFNHEPCQRKGHKAHWAVSAGVLLGVQDLPSLGYSEDPELPGLFYPVPGMPCQLPSLPEEGFPGAVYLLSKQGKSWHYQLWDYDQVRDSNLQLTDFSPSRANDGRAYVVPAGGVRAGLCGQALLLRQ